MTEHVNISGDAGDIHTILKELGNVADEFIALAEEIEKRRSATASVPEDKHDLAKNLKRRLKDETSLHEGLKEKQTEIAKGQREEIQRLERGLEQAHDSGITLLLKSSKDENTIHELRDRIFRLELELDVREHLIRGLETDKDDLERRIDRLANLFQRSF